MERSFERNRKEEPGLSAGSSNHSTVPDDVPLTDRSSVLCPEDPTRTCTDCLDYDECPYPDRRSSTRTIGLPLLLAVFAFIILFVFLLRS